MLQTKENKSLKAGRPVTICKDLITKKCLEFYMDYGIDNKSFNDVIRYAGVSKGSIYRLYGTEDSLQRSALAKYCDSYIEEWLRVADKEGSSLKSLIMNITSSLITGKDKCCLYHRTKSEKYKLGSKTKLYLSKINKRINHVISNLVKKDFITKGRKLKNSEIKEITNFIINNLTNINLLKLNNASHKTILDVSNALLRYLKNY